MIAWRHSGSFNSEVLEEIDSRDCTDGGKHNKSLHVILTAYCTAHKPYTKRILYKYD